MQALLDDLQRHLFLKMEVQSVSCKEFYLPAAETKIGLLALRASERDKINTRCPKLVALH